MLHKLKGSGSLKKEFAMNPSQVKELMVSNPDKDFEWYSTQTGRTAERCRKIYASLAQGGLVPPKRVNSQNTLHLSPEQQFQLDLEKVRMKESGNDKKYRVALAELVKLRDELETLTSVRGAVTSYTIKPTKSQKHESTAFAIASDWHVFENVKPESVDGTNEYTSQIARKRADAFFRNTLKLVKKEQQDADIKTLVLALLGDFISGNIHEELLESCEGAPVEEAMFAQSLLASGIEYILANSALNLVIPCCVGNHSRITHQVHVSTEQGNSLEWMIYNNLADRFRDNKRVTFVMSKSYFTFLEVYGYTVRFHHGHAIKYGGGIGGLTTPVIKAIARYDLDKKATLDVFGHFHQKFDGGKFIVNGCLIGNTPYGKRLGFTGQPEQVFFLMDSKKGKTGVFPIFVD